MRRINHGNLLTTRLVTAITSTANYTTPILQKISTIIVTQVHIFFLVMTVLLKDTCAHLSVTTRVSRSPKIPIYEAGQTKPGRSRVNDR